MTRFFTLVFATVGGWLGWKLGMYVGLLTAYFSSVVGTAVGLVLYAARTRRVAGAKPSGWTGKLKALFAGQTN